MPRLLTTILFCAAAVFATQALAAKAPKKGTYASCMATAMKHGSTERNAALWCTRHGYN